MRDLDTILKNLKTFYYDESFLAVCDERKLSFPLGVVYEAMERAIKAEAEVERLRLMVTSITGGLDEAIEAVHCLEAENALLRKVEEVGEIMWGDAICHRCNARECRGCSAHDFKQALSEYQSWKEGQELDKEGER